MRWLTRLMDLREGEARPAIEAFLALFGIIAGHTILETARDALFLSKLPPSRLAFVYVLLAALTLVVTAANAHFVRRFGQRNALIFTLLAAAYGTTVLHFVALTQVALFVLYTWSALVGTVLGVQFWMFAGQRFTVTQGKRLFGPIAAGGVIGAVTGAGAAVAALALVPVTSLLLVSAGLFLVTAVFLTTVRSVDVHAEAKATSAAPDGDEAPQESVGELFHRYPYLRQMALLAALSTSTLLVGDYLFKSLAAQRVPAAELGAFFARTYAVLNALSLAVQLFLTGRVLRQVGVVPALVILPLLMLGGAGGIVLSGGSLAMALVIKGADGSLRYSLQRVAGELLWMPLPSDVRTRAKALLDSVFGRLSQALVAGGLLLLATFHLGPPRVLAAIVAILAAGWMVTTVAMRSSYLDLFRQALSRGSLDLALEAQELDLGSIESVMDALSSPEPQRVTAAIGILQDKGRSRLVPGLILFHDSEAVLLRALELGQATDRHDWIPLMMSRLLGHPAEAVRAATVRTLVHLGESDAVRPALEDKSPVVRAHAAFNLATESGAERPSDDPTIRELLALEGDAGRAVAVALLDAIRDHADARWIDVLLELVEDARPDVAEHATMAMATIKAPEMIPALIRRLDRREGRASVRQALVLQGEAAFEALLQTLDDPGTPERRRFHLPRTIARFGTQRAVDVLTDIIVKDRQGFVRYKALRGLGRLAAGQDDEQRTARDAALRFDRARLSAEMRRNLIEHLRLISVAAALEQGDGVPSSSEIAAGASLVLGLLGDKQRQSLERAFRLLQILHRDEDIRSAHAALVTGDRRLRGQAMEFLDTLTLSRRRPTPEAREARELLRLIADDLPTADRVERSLAFIPRPPATYEDALVKLMSDRDPLLATFAAYHALDIGTPRLIAAVTRICVERPYLNIATPLGARAEQSIRSARMATIVEVSHGG